MRRGSVGGDGHIAPYECSTKKIGKFSSSFPVYIDRGDSPNGKEQKTKQKKIILTGALVLALCLCLTACAGKRDSLGVISNQETGVKLTLGMTREEVEAALSPEEKAERPEEACQLWTTNYGKGEDGVQVAYDWEADTVVQLAFGKDQTHWVLDDVVPLGAAQKEIEKQYGAPTFLNQEGNPSLTYNYNVDGVQTDGSDTD